jgi:hypothetical protein
MQSFDDLPGQSHFPLKKKRIHPEVDKESKQNRETNQGNFARTSTLPYRKLKLSAVRILAEETGLTIFPPAPPVLAHPYHALPKTVVRKESSAIRKAEFLPVHNSGG